MCLISLIKDHSVNATSSPENINWSVFLCQSSVPDSSPWKTEQPKQWLKQCYTFVFAAHMKLDCVKRLFYVKAVISGNIESALQVKKRNEI